MISMGNLKLRSAGKHLEADGNNNSQGQALDGRTYDGISPESKLT